MLTIPTNPYAFQDRVIGALIGDILDTGQRGFARLDALRAVTASADTRPQGGDAKQAPFTSGAVPKADAQNTPGPHPMKDEGNG